MGWLYIGVSAAGCSRSQEGTTRGGGGDRQDWAGEGANRIWKREKAQSSTPCSNTVQVGAWHVDQSRGSREGTGNGPVPAARCLIATSYDSVGMVPLPGPGRPTPPVAVARHLRHLACATARSQEPGPSRREGGQGHEPKGGIESPPHQRHGSDTVPFLCLPGNRE